MQQEGSCALIYSMIALSSQMPGVLWEILCLIYIRAHALIIYRDQRGWADSFIPCCVLRYILIECGSRSLPGIEELAKGTWRVRDPSHGPGVFL
jgi:hypothetical protein